MGVLLKFLLKRNPQYLDKIDASKLNDEVIDYAIKAGYKIDYTKANRRYMLYPSFVKAVVDSDLPESFSLLANAENFSYGMMEAIVNKFLNGENSFQDYDITKYINFKTHSLLSEEPRLLLKAIETTPDLLRDIHTIPDAIKGNKIDRIIIENNFTIKDFSDYTVISPRVMKHFLETDFKETIIALEEDNTGKYVDVIKEVFFDDLENNIKYLGRNF